MRTVVLVHLAVGPQPALATLAALAELPAEPEHAVVLVDASGGALDDLLARVEGDVRVVRPPAATGLAAAVTAVAADGGHDVLAVLRAPARPAGDWLAPLVAALDGDAALAVATSETSGRPGASPALAHALAVRPADVRAAGGAPDAPDDRALAALALALAGGGAVRPVPGSVVVAPQDVVSARGHLGEDVEVSVVVPTLDAASARVGEALRAIEATLDAPHEVLLVHNGAPPQGYAAPVNAGIRAARGRYVVVMNDDVQPLPGWWGPLRAALDGGAAVAFPRTEGGFNHPTFAAWCFALTRATIAEHAVAPGEFLDPELRVWFQDTDLLARLNAAGTPPVRVEASAVRHSVSTTLETEDPELRRWIAEQQALDERAFKAKHPEIVLRSFSIER